MGDVFVVSPPFVEFLSFLREEILGGEFVGELLPLGALILVPVEVLHNPLLLADGDATR